MALKYSCIIFYRVLYRVFTKLISKPLSSYTTSIRAKFCAQLRIQKGDVWYLFLVKGTRHNIDTVNGKSQPCWQQKISHHGINLHDAVDGRLIFVHFKRFKKATILVFVFYFFLSLYFQKFHTWLWFLQLKNTSVDWNKAQEAMFSRHPVMKKWPDSKLNNGSNLGSKLSLLFVLILYWFLYQQYYCTCIFW